MEECPFCYSQDKKYQNKEFQTNIIGQVECVKCGKFNIEKPLSEDIASYREYTNKRYILSGITREASYRGNTIEITEDKIQDILDSASVPDGPFEKIDRILQYVYYKADSDASSVPIVPLIDYPIAYAKDPNEFLYYLNNAIELGYLKADFRSSMGNGQFSLNLDGWKRVDDIEKRKIESHQAFVAMWFNGEMKEVYMKGFEPALLKTGYKPIRADLVEHNEKICDRIIAEIRKSGLLVADFTGNRGGVYFEAGFAKGLGIPVIWTCHKDHLDDVHFDTRQYKHILWENPDDLEKQLIDRIEATLPNRVKSR